MASGRRQYPFHLIEPKWQHQWEQQQAFRAWNPGEAVPAGHPFAQRHTNAQPEDLPKFYILDMFPYPSGAGLHVGHPEGYTATDILARYRRALGYNVLHPMGWDAFGLPAEQYAIKTRQHPRKTTEANIANFKRQIKSLGFSYDWTREVDTTDPQYFRWTQWIFLQLYNSWFNPQTNKAEPIAALPYPPELQSGAAVSPAALEQQRRAFRDSKRLAYVTEAPVWWCEQLGTVLANEEVVDGKSEVGGFPVVRKPMRQWMLRITAYAERLLKDLETIDWSDSLKEMQRNWIGRSEGAEVDFRMADAAEVIRVFTTRPDTLFGATYMVLAPEHKLVDVLTTPAQRAAVKAYQAEVAKKSDLERTELAKEKTGVFTGGYAVNPVNGEKIPIWIADYVLISYGTGAIMAVPGHDTRDFEFATKFNLPIIQVVEPPKGVDWHGYVEDGVSVNSASAEISISGLPTPEAKRKITAWLESKQLGKKTINYKLRDWLFSRQRYWGEPFPIVWKNGADGQPYHEALPESALPLLPPPLDDYKPTPDGQPPLARAKDWVSLPDGSKRETNTMPQWAGSCWYYLRYLDARNSERFVDPRAEEYWMGTAGATTLAADVQDVAAGILPAVEGGILPPGALLESASLTAMPRAIPPGRMPGSTAGKMPAATSRVGEGPHPSLSVRLGSLRWLEQSGVDIAAGNAFVREWAAKGASLVGLAAGNNLAALFAVKDTVKPGAGEVIRQLQAQGVNVYLLTGDNALTAASIAAQVGIPSDNVFAEVRPEQKAEFVQKLQRQGERVAFVGDGINDAPALEQADLGVAVSRASDVAREAADIILLRSEIEAVPEALGLARATLRTIKQNLFWAFFYNAIGVPLAALGFMSPILCAAAMGVSDLVVIGNALRLRRWRLRSGR